MNISVIGCGYLGAVHAAAMAELGHTVLGIDVDQAKVEALNAGRAPFFEPGFEEILRKGIASGKLRFSSAPTHSELAKVSVHFIAVGTPQSATSGAADLSFVNAALDSIANGLGEHAIVVGKSTVPVGTARMLAARIDVPLVWNPEFLREGFAVSDTLHPDRIVYGLPDDPLAAAKSRNMLDCVYASLLAEEIPAIHTNYETAELVKVAANSFLATKISFINAVADLCDVTGGDVQALADAIGHDDRIGRKFLGAGVGFGGGCLPKDIRAFQARAEELGVQSISDLLSNVDDINESRRRSVVERATELLGGEVAGTKVCILGAAFKPNSDDIRDSPALDIALRLSEAGAQVSITDPKALEHVRSRHPELRTVATVEEALEGADVVLLLTEWSEYVRLDPAFAAKRAKMPRIIDGRNALQPQVWKDAGWQYVGLGQ